MRFGAAIAAVGGALCLLASPSLAQTVTDPTAPATPPPAPKDNSPPSSFTFTGAYTVDLLGNLGGGQASGARYIDLLKLSAAYDGALAGRQGLTGLISIEHSNGASVSGELVGASQAVSSIEASPEPFRLYEAWIQKEILGGAGGVKAGLIDLNTTFDVQETAALFLNSSDGEGPELSDTGLNGPSIFPTPAVAVTAFWRPAEGWTAQAGLFDGVAGDPNHRGRFVAILISPSDGALIIAQVERRFGDAARIEAGAWTYTSSSFAALDQLSPSGAPKAIGGDAGLYGLIEGQLAAKPRHGDGGLSGWLRVGLANGDINRIANYLGAGLVYTGPIAGRDKDQVGVAINRAGFGAGARAAAMRAGVPLAGAETTFEATYRYAVKDWLNVQPDLQYVIHPGGNLALGDALVVGVRLAFTASR
ncbi:MAG: carbohydrate porin [Pseudomonadota bacterium]|nr:carbohydrate porin [Pseudomonadota bacterium]